jgi:osmoprotectant transport system ATP-binding protein
LVVLLGPSGCGKTTLLKTVNRLVEPTHGRVLLEGEDVRAQPATALRRRIGYVIQATGLFPHLSVGRNIGVVPELLGWQPPAIAARVDALLTLVNLPTAYRDRYPRQLSGGEAQRVGLARALAADPAFLLMDEPFGAIDAINRDHLQAALLEIQHRLHKTILFVTHDVEEAMRLADRVAVMRAGRLVQFGSPLELLVHPADAFVRELLGGDDLFRRLRLVPIGSIMEPAEGAGDRPTDLASTALQPVIPAPQAAVPTLHPATPAREALTALVAAGMLALPVQDADGQVVGKITFDAIHRASR